jgi:hypothetical protein
MWGWYQGRVEALGLQHSQQALHAQPTARAQPGGDSMNPTAPISFMTNAFIPL